MSAQTGKNWLAEVRVNGVVESCYVRANHASDAITHAVTVFRDRGYDGEHGTMVWYKDVKVTAEEEW